MKPKQIQYDKGKTSVLWDDGHESVYPHLHMRNLCPCATCRDMREEKGKEPYVMDGKTELVPKEILPVGRYALQFVWDDGHDTGLYSYEYLRAICACDACAKKNEEVKA